MFIVFYLIIFILGLVVGSFLNCVIYRLGLKEKEPSSFLKELGSFSFVKGRSFCPTCRHSLSWKDLIPVLSFLALKGKCRYCKGKISIQYPFVEIATGLISLLIFNIACRDPVSVFFLFAISCFLIIIFVYDLKHFIIPDKIIYPAIVVAFLYQLFRILNFSNWNLFGIWNFEFGILKPFLNPLFAALGGALFFLLIFLVSRGNWMGFGDVKLAFLMGLLLGFPNILVALFIAFMIGAIIGVGLILAKKKTLKSEVPFGPFLVAGTFIALFWGENLISWYLNLFN